MKITAIQTEAVTARATSLSDLVDRYLPVVPPGSVVAVASKVVALCEGRTVSAKSVTKPELAFREADYYLPPEHTSYGYTLTVKSDILVASAGVDESNGNGDFILWPHDPQRSANRLRAHLRKQQGPGVGVIITDSRSTPMRRGSIGVGLAHSGFLALKNYVGTPDIFGRRLKYIHANVLDGLAAAAVVAMGEGAEQTPLVLIEEAPVTLQDRNPTRRELEALRVRLEDDLYAEMLRRIPWTKRPQAEADQA